MQTDREKLILGLPRRPRGENQGAATVIGTLLGLILTENPGGAVLGGLAGNVLANQSLPLENAVRNYFAQKSLPVIFFYRSPKAIKIIFSLFGQFWTVESSVPDLLNLAKEDVEDWLYGNLIKNELPKKLKRIHKSLKV